MYMTGITMAATDLSRRKFIRLAGGGSLFAAAGFGLTGCDRMPAEAISGWTGPGADAADPRRTALAYALLAPNAHNIQPWLVDLRERDTVVLHVDRQRLLPETDPFSRQILISQGTFLGLLRIAAAELGYRIDLELFPEGEFATDAIDDRPVARCRFVAADEDGPAGAPDPLFAEILHRRSNKEVYRPEPLTIAHADQLTTSLHQQGEQPGQPSGWRCDIAREGTLVARLRDLTAEAIRIEMSTPRTHRESVMLTRVGSREIARHRDGIDLHGPMFWWVKRLGLMTPEKAMTPGTLAYQGGLDYALGWSQSTPSFGWLTSPDNSRTRQVESGEAYVRLNLLATALGVAMHPVSQLLQEYPEMRPLQQVFLSAVGATEPGHVQMLFRLGYADVVPPSPRRDLGDLMIGAS